MDELKAHDRGLIRAHLLAQPSSVKLTWEDVTNWDKSMGPLWIHLDRTDDFVEQWLRTNSDIEPAVVNSLLKDDTRPRFSEVGEDELLIIVKGVNLNLEESPEEMISLRIWTDGNRLISLGFRPLKSVAAVGSLIASGKGPTTIDDLLLQMIKNLDIRIEPIVYELSKQLDDFESGEIIKGEPDEFLLHELQSKASAFKRHLAPQRDVLHRMRQTNNELLKKQRSHWRELFFSLEVYVEELTEVNERIAILNDAKNQQLLTQTNQTMYMLSIVAAIFLPLSFLTGLLGINVGGIPGVENPYAFIIICIIAVIIGIAEVIYFKSKKWL